MAARVLVPVLTDAGHEVVFATRFRALLES